MNRQNQFTMLMPPHTIKHEEGQFTINTIGWNSATVYVVFGFETEQGNISPGGELSYIKWDASDVDFADFEPVVGFKDATIEIENNTLTFTIPSVHKQYYMLTIGALKTKVNVCIFSMSDGNTYFENRIKRLYGDGRPDPYQEAFEDSFEWKPTKENQ